MVVRGLGVHPLRGQEHEDGEQRFQISARDLQFRCGLFSSVEASKFQFQAHYFCQTTIQSEPNGMESHKGTGKRYPIVL